jgi:hypothetical protein
VAGKHPPDYRLSLMRFLLVLLLPPSWEYRNITCPVYNIGLYLPSGTWLVTYRLREVNWCRIWGDHSSGNEESCSIFRVEEYVKLSARLRPSCSCCVWWFLAWLTLLSWRWKQYALLNRRWTSTGLHGVTL